MPEPSPPLSGPRWLRPVLVAMVVVWLGARVLPGAWSEQPFGITWDKQGKPERFRDFTSHTRLARSVWGGDRTDESGAPVSSVYAPGAHRRMASTWVGQPTTEVLPFAYSPTMAWLLTPFAFLPDRDAYLLWTALALALVAWQLGWQDGPWPAGCLMYLSPTATWCFYQGQTAVFSCAAFLLLLGCALRPPGPRRAWLPGLALWALTAKPPLAVAAAAALLACGRWRVVALAMPLTALSTALLTPWLGADWAADYLNLARSYNSVQADPAFAWCLKPTYMSNLRGALYAAGIGDVRATQVTTCLWLAAQGGLVLASRLGQLPGGAVWALSLLAVLLFAPHANVTEDLHLYVAAVAAYPLVAAWAGPFPRLFPFCFAAVFWLGCLLQTNSPWLWPWPAFLGKVALAALVVGLGWAARVERSELFPA